jgi:glycosyltransferase involved in cell wall biosynthesis
VVDDFKRQFRGHVIYSRNENNLGMPGNLNKALSLASGRLILNLHDGDVYSPGLFERGVALLQRYPNAGLAFWDDADRWGTKLEVNEITPGSDFFERFFLPRANSIIWGTALVRAEVYGRLLPFDPTFKAWADVDMWMRICQSYDIAHLDGGPFVRLLEEGPFRAWNWEKALMIHRIFLINISRMFCDNELRQKTEIRRRVWIGRRAWCRHMIGRIRRGEWRLFFRGLSYFSAFFFKSSLAFGNDSSNHEPRDLGSNRSV